MILTYNKTCTDCTWNAVCIHKKIFWDGVQYQYVTAFCRDMKGNTYIPSSLPDEPLDWYQWAQFTKPKLVTYGRNQFIIELDVCNSNIASSRVTKIRDSVKDIPQRDTLAKPLLGLKSVYDNNDTESQGSLF